MTTINQGDLDSFPVPLPNLNEQAAIAGYLDDLDQAQRNALSRVANSRALLRMFIKTEVNCV
jgi:restriction endonuclease S subunit